MKKKNYNWIRQSLLLGMIGLLFVAFSCKKDREEPSYEVKVTLVYPSEYLPQAGVKVTLKNTASGMSFEALTNEQGDAEFAVIAGTYNITASESRVVEATNTYRVFNGVLSNQPIGGPAEFRLPLTVSTTSQVVIKELYTGGCQKDDGSGAFSNDKYVILYNNSGAPATLRNLCFGMVNPYNSNVATNADYVGEVLRYESEKWIPAGMGIWYCPQDITLDPGKQMVVAVMNAIDLTPTYSNSINFNNAAYYCMYHLESGFKLESYYPAPAPNIPESHYLRAILFGQGTAWSLSNTSPAFFVFTTPNTPQEFVDDESKRDAYNNSTSAANARRKVSVDWVLDAIEVFAYQNSQNKKRLTAAVDAGYIELYNQQGFTLYRNVDKAATEALPENEGKIVYGYSLGTVGVTIGEATINGSTDPSGIDAEASIKNGARIIYQDTNNTTNDFHQRSRASLRD